MASAPVPPSTPGVGSSQWSSQPGGNTRTGWGRGGEPGSAFRGLGKGRGGGERGGRGGGPGRGGRGGRTGSGRGGAPSKTDGAAPKATTDPPKDKPPKPVIDTSKLNPPSAPKESKPNTPKVPGTPRIPSTPKISIIPKIPPNPPKSSGSQKPSISPITPTTPSSASKTPTRSKPARKNSEQKGVRKPPSVNGDAALGNAAANSPTTSTSSRSSRRKRAGHNKSTSNAPPPPRKASISINEPVPRSKPSKPGPAKDLPPHLAVSAPHPETPTFDMKNDIDALVERVRAVAMDRPHTPGSHFDWAGEDDDSLPDLDDWGVTSNLGLSAPSKDDGEIKIISPILEGTLKLPAVEVDAVAPVASAEESFVDEPPVVVPLTQEDKSTLPTPTSPPPLQALTQPTVVINDAEKVDSIPAVNVEVQSDSQEILEVSKGAVGSSQPAPLKPDAPAPAVQDQYTSPVVSPTPSIHIEPALSSGLAQSIHAPSNSRLLDSLSASSRGSSPDRGSSMSIHALSTTSAPSHLSTFNHNNNRRGGGRFNPTHTRAHTVGKPPSYRVPHSASDSSFSTLHSDSERPRRGDQPHHARTHSTPPGTIRNRTHASRPVITGDAISKLARQLGGTPLLKRAEAAPISTMNKD